MYTTYATILAMASIAIGSPTIRIPRQVSSLNGPATAEAQVRDDTATRAFSNVQIKTSDGQCLFVDPLSGDFRENLTPIQVAACGGSNQGWDIITAGKHINAANSMLVVSTTTQACLNFDDRRKAGNQVLLFSCGGRADGGGAVTNSQEMGFIDGSGQIKPSNANGQCIVVNGSKLDIGACGGANSQFTFGGASTGGTSSGSTGGASSAVSGSTSAAAQQSGSQKTTAAAQSPATQQPASQATTSAAAPNNAASDSSSQCGGKVTVTVTAKATDAANNAAIVGTSASSVAASVLGDTSSAAATTVAAATGSSSVAAAGSSSAAAAGTSAAANAGGKAIPNPSTPVPVSRAGGTLVPTAVAESQKRDDSATRAFSSVSIKAPNGQCLFVDPTAGDFRENLIPVSLVTCGGTPNEKFDLITKGVHNNAANSAIIVSSLMQGCISFDGRRATGDTVTMFSCGGRADGNGATNNGQTFPFIGEESFAIAPDSGNNQTCVIPGDGRLTSGPCPTGGAALFSVVP